MKAPDELNVSHRTDLKKGLQTGGVNYLLWLAGTSLVLCSRLADPYRTIAQVCLFFEPIPEAMDSEEEKLSGDASDVDSEEERLGMGAPLPLA